MKTINWLCLVIAFLSFSACTATKFLKLEDLKRDTQLKKSSKEYLKIAEILTLEIKKGFIERRQELEKDGLELKKSELGIEINVDFKKDILKLKMIIMVHEPDQGIYVYRLGSIWDKCLEPGTLKFKKTIEALVEEAVSHTVVMPPLLASIEHQVKKNLVLFFI